jgi:hypothetical protein
LIKGERGLRFQTKILLIFSVIQVILSVLAVATTEYAILNGAIETNPSSAYEQAHYGRPISYLLYLTRRFVFMILPIGGYYAFRFLLFNSFKNSRSKLKQFNTKLCESLPLILPLGVLITTMLFTIPDVYNNWVICWFYINAG